MEDEEGQIYIEPLPRISDNEALQAVYILKRYEEESRSSDGAFLKALYKFERDLVQSH